MENTKENAQPTSSPDNGAIAKWPGLFIVFEGIDGTGKSSQIKRLASFLENLGHNVLTTREPSDGTFGTKLRSLFYNRETISKEEELQLFIDDRKEHLQKTVLPALKKGQVVLCDRYFPSTIAYQGATGAFGIDELLAKNSFAPAPDIALLLAAPVDLCIQRITKGRNEKLNDFEKRDFLQKADAIFASLQFPWLKRIDCSDTMDEVEQEIRQIIEPLLQQKQQDRGHKR